MNLVRKHEDLVVPGGTPILPLALTKEGLLGKAREAYDGVHEHCTASCAPRRAGGRSPRPVRLLETLAGGRVPRPPLPDAPSLEGGALLRRGRLCLARLPHLPGRSPPLPPPSLGRRARAGPSGLRGDVPAAFGLP